ncbi:MAG: tetratricopeptide repeat protein [Bacteroidetes bacterium]|nr:tetratricopeptide repeat protein [Bacteroidota bacterium]
MDRASRRDMLLEMLGKEPNDLFLNYALAMEYMASEEFGTAETQLLKVLSIDATHLPCFYQLGKIYEQLGTPEKALGYYKQGLALAQKQGNKKAQGELNEAIWLLED